MEQFQFLRDKANEKIKVADHMLFMTYPLLKDPKLLLSVVENVHCALDYAVASLLHHEKLFKRIPAFQETWQSRFDMFKNTVVPQQKINQSYVKLISDVKILLTAHKKSPVSFAKNDKFVILSPKYDIKQLDVNMVKKYVFEAKIFVQQINVIVSKNERIFARS